MMLFNPTDEMHRVLNPSLNSNMEYEHLQYNQSTIHFDAKLSNLLLYLKGCRFNRIRAMQLILDNSHDWVFQTRPQQLQSEPKEIEKMMMTH